MIIRVCNDQSGLLNQLGGSGFPQALLLLDGYVPGRFFGCATRLLGAGDQELGQDKHERESLRAARCVRLLRVPSRYLSSGFVLGVLETAILLGGWLGPAAYT